MKFRNLLKDNNNIDISTAHRRMKGYASKALNTLINVCITYHLSKLIYN